MKNIKILFGLLLLPLSVFSQGTFDSKYVFKASHYYESIDLLKDGTFVYYNEMEFIRSEIKGNWQLRNDSILVLDSRPQRNKLIVFESRERSKKMTFHVRDMDNCPVYYYLYLITNGKDTIEFKEQFDKTATDGNFTSFYIVDTKGLHSPVYKIKGTRANFFNIMIEERRVFENEYWKYYGKYIIPLGIDGKYSKYKLIKDSR